MQIAADTLTAEAAYKLLTGSIVPRPIAWVTTLSIDDRVNAAPFSAFTFVSNKPPMLGISIGRRAGVLKDTARNIMQRREFVVNIADRELLEPLHLSAQEFPEDLSEIAELSIEVAAAVSIATPRIAAAPVAMECRLANVLEFGDFKTNFFVGEVITIHVRDGLAENGKIDTRRLNPICRLGGPNYAGLGEIVTLPAIYVTPK
jgi:flavin reductase (DIM6/NTAB) family NADH-FMN oxidoreductase RutF